MSEWSADEGGEAPWGMGGGGWMRREGRRDREHLNCEAGRELSASVEGEESTTKQSIPGGRPCAPADSSEGGCLQWPCRPRGKA
jgi:hypothetical protein